MDLWKLILNGTINIIFHQHDRTNAKDDAIYIIWYTIAGVIKSHHQYM